MAAFYYGLLFLGRKCLHATSQKRALSPAISLAVKRRVRIAYDTVFYAIIFGFKLSLLISFPLCISCFQRIQLFRKYVSPLQLMLCRIAAVKSLPEHHYIAEIIFCSFGSIVFIFGFSKIKLCLGLGARSECCTVPFLVLKRLNQYESAISFLRLNIGSHKRKHNNFFLQ